MLHAHEVVDLDGNFFNRCRCDRNSCAAGDVIDQDWKACQTSNPDEVFGETVLWRFDVVRCDDEHGVSAGTLGVSRQFSSFRKGLRSGCRNHCNSAVRSFDGRLEKIFPLLNRKAAGFTCCSSDNNAV